MYNELVSSWPSPFWLEGEQMITYEGEDLVVKINDELVEQIICKGNKWYIIIDYCDYIAYNKSMDEERVLLFNEE